MREQVFIDEQQVPREDERGRIRRRHSRHVLARDAQGNPIGTGRLTPDAHDRSHGRARGLARPPASARVMLDTLLEQARALAYPDVRMHAQTHAPCLSTRASASSVMARSSRNATFRISTCAWNWMPSCRRRNDPSPPPRPRSRNVAVESREQAMAETLRLIGDSEARVVHLHARRLTRTSARHRRCAGEAQALGSAGAAPTSACSIQEPQATGAARPPADRLAQRLSSVFAFRTPVQEEDLQYPSAFLLNDSRGYYFRSLGNRFEGEAINYASGQARAIARILQPGLGTRRAQRRTSPTGALGMP